MNKLRHAVQLALGTTMSNRAIGREVGIAFNNVRRYRIVADAKGYVLAELLKLDDEGLRRCFNTVPCRNEDKRLPDWIHIHAELQRKHMTLQLLWEEYCSSDPDTAYMYSQFTHLHREWAKRHDLSMLQQHVPGERGWVDFLGPTIPWVDAATGEIRHAQIFAAAAGVSHLLFAYAVHSQASECWIEAHNRWYQFLDGVPKITVTDNLKAGVIRAGSDPVINPTYLEMGRHYGTVIVPTRSRKPKDKAKVEGGVLIIERWALGRLRNRTFHSLAEINVALRECIDLINDREMRLYKASRRTRFEQIDHPHLLKLPGTPFEYGEWLPTIRVGNDYHVPVKGNRYSVPYRLVREQVTVRLTASMVEIYHRRERVAAHQRSYEIGGTTTEPAHQPDAHRAWSEQSPERYRSWAITVGTNALAVIEHQFATAVHGVLALKACSGLQGLAKRFGNLRFEAACAEALRIKSPNRKSIRSLLQNRLEQRGANGDRTATQRLPSHSNVRGPDYYRNEEGNHVD